MGLVCLLLFSLFTHNLGGRPNLILTISRNNKRIIIKVLVDTAAIIVLYGEKSFNTIRDILAVKFARSNVVPFVYRIKDA